MRVTLEIIGGPIARRRLVLDLPAVIGRSRTVQLTIAHPLVSRRHCELLENEAGMLLVRDLDSTNGTYVGQQRISEAVVEPGGEFTVGPLSFRADYQLPESESPPAESPWAELPAAFGGMSRPATPAEMPDQPPVPDAPASEAAAPSEGGDLPGTEPGDGAVTQLPGRPDVAGQGRSTPAAGPAPRAETRRRPPSWSDGPLADSRWHFPIEPIEHERFDAARSVGPADAPATIPEETILEPAAGPPAPPPTEHVPQFIPETTPRPLGPDADPAAPPEPTLPEPPAREARPTAGATVGSPEGDGPWEAHESSDGGESAEAGGSCATDGSPEEEGSPHESQRGGTQLGGDDEGADDIDPALRDFLKGLP